MNQSAAGTLGIPYLYGYWERQLQRRPKLPGTEDLDFALLGGLGLPLLGTLRHLHQKQPTLEAFEAWILEQNGGMIEPSALERLHRALAGEEVASEIGNLDEIEGLSADDLAHWDEHGYVIVRGAVPLAQARAAESAVYEYLGADPSDPETWYGNPQGRSIWVSLYHHPAIWANRRSPRLIKAFAQLWGKEDLWPTVDQAGLNPPERPGWQFPGPHLHWDSTIAAPHCFGTQGILYLADVAAEQGAFTCIPGFHRTLDSWLASLPAGADPRQEILRHRGAIPVAASAGDLVIWHQSLPHASSPNRATRPRVAQYINLKPTRWEHHAQWL